jgi:D-beta-D-heptose 7-phosphate kinase/D-beta-D-heptose 1-phosphate adenosyltransferase
MSKVKTVAVSGGFDPIHIGHIRMFRDAKKLGDRLLVILNSDKFLKEKKGFIFMPFKERKEIIESIRYVDKVVPCFDKDDTVCNTLSSLKPDVFANGGDRKEGNVPEKPICEKYGIEMVYNVGGNKIQSSSWLTRKLYVKKKRLDDVEIEGEEHFFGDGTNLD